MFQAELGMASSTGSSSPRDSEAGFHATSETASLSGSLTGSDDLTRDDVMPPPPPPPTWTNASHGTYVSYSARGRSEVSLRTCGQKSVSESSLQYKIYSSLTHSNVFAQLVTAQLCYWVGILLKLQFFSGVGTGVLFTHVAACFY